MLQIFMNLTQFNRNWFSAEKESSFFFKWFYVSAKIIILWAPFLSFINNTKTSRQKSKKNKISQGCFDYWLLLGFFFVKKKDKCFLAPLYGRCRGSKLMVHYEVKNMTVWHCLYQWLSYLGFLSCWTIVAWVKVWWEISQLWLCSSTGPLDHFSLIWDFTDQ